MMTSIRKRTGLAGLALATGLILSACAAEQPAPTPTPDAPPETPVAELGTIVVGSQDYYSNEIVAEIYAQALEAEGYTVERRYRIGQRAAYVPAIEAGEVNLFPEYTGNLLREVYSPDTTATTADDVYAELVSSLPEQLAALAMSPATDQDSYNVTAEFAEANGLTSIADLANLEGLTLGGAPELEERPYGPTGLLETYGVTVAFEATGALTVDALLEGVVDVANVYSGDPSIARHGLVTLADPEGLFLAANIVPIVSAELAAELAPIIDPISKALTSEGLVNLNLRSTADELSAAVLAAEWLEANGF
jgi:osmoprotectant transport system substrate-binding protein